MRSRRVAGSATLILLLAACGGNSPPGPDVIARIDGEELRYSDFEAFMVTDLGESASVALASEVLSALFDRYLDEELMHREAVRQGLVEKGASRREASAALLADAVAEVASKGEIERFYEQNIDRYRLPEQVELRQILVADRTTAETALAEIEEGAEFVAVSSRYSSDPSAADGGHQGVLAREDLPKAFAGVVFGLEAGEVSPVVAADYGFHIFQVVSRRPGSLVSLEEAALDIDHELARRRGDRALEKVVADAQERYNLAVYERNLPFVYTGKYRPSEGS